MLHAILFTFETSKEHSSSKSTVKEVLTLLAIDLQYLSSSLSLNFQHKKSLFSAFLAFQVCLSFIIAILETIE